jgi:hypothetical protein
MRFEKAAAKKIKKSMLRELQNKKLELTNTGNKAISRAIHSYPRAVYDTGNLERNSNTLIFTYSDGVIIRLRTNDTPYAIYPYYGLGTSRNYGARPYLEKAAGYVLKDLGIKK